jgi:hypothetical protein
MERKGTVTDENVKWTGENVLPSRPQAVLLIEIIFWHDRQSAQLVLSPDQTVGTRAIVQ